MYWSGNLPGTLRMRLRALGEPLEPFPSLQSSLICALSRCSLPICNAVVHLSSVLKPNKGSQAVFPALSHCEPPKERLAMSLPQRSIGRGSAGLTGSAVAFGCMSLVGGLNSGTPNEEESIKIIRHALTTGVTILNTANLYGTSRRAPSASGCTLSFAFWLL